jgi:hypothetical protein
MSSSAPPRSASPAGRQRAIRIVGAVVAASVALTIVALVRSPGGSSAASGSAAVQPTSVVAATATATAPAAATAAATASAMVAAAVPTATAVATADAGVKAATATTVKKKEPARDVRTPYDNVPAKNPRKEPALVRDPGF